jgi:hypothetical protein
MKNVVLLVLGMLAFWMDVQAQSEKKEEKPKFLIVGLNVASLLADQLQFDAEFGREQTHLSVVASVFYGSSGPYKNRNELVFSGAQNFGVGVGLRIYETTLSGTRFFMQPGIYYKQLAVTHQVMGFVPVQYDGLPALQWGPTNQIDQYRGYGGELLAGSQTFLGPLVLEGAIGFVFRKMNPLQQVQKKYSAGAELALGIGEFSPIAQFKIGYKF